ncbi:MAG: VOC family protein [Woeseiaceae bacterium]|nr:VOC family protein [Woeseiaceae bacterium]
MIAYTMLGTNDLEKAAAFYDALFAEMGVSRAFDSDRFVNYSRGDGGPAFAITKPYDGNPATVGNGVMISLGMRSAEDVDRLHKKALELGATDEGAPGPRGPRFYIGYFRDLDGNKLNFFALLPKS